MAVPAREMEDDSVLVRAVQDGDLEAFSELFRRHYPDVQRSCARRMASSLEAEEVAQAAFVRALERIGQCRGERQFGGWVQIIARHLCVDALRTRSRVVPSASPMSEDHADGNEPHDSLLDRERRDDVRRALETLPLRQRQAVTARAQGSGPRQIAHDLGLSVGAVDSLLLRGRQRLALAYRRVAGEGGATATATSATAAASLLAAFTIGSTRLLGGVAAAAEAGRDLVGPVVSGVTGAILSVAVAFTGAGPSADTEPARANAPPAVVVSVPHPDPAVAFPAHPGNPADSGRLTTGSPDAASGPSSGRSHVGPPGAPTAAGVGAPTASLAGAGAAAAGVSGPAGGTTTGSANGPTSAQGPAGVPVDVPPAPVVDPMVDAIGGTVPGATDTVDDSTAVVDDVGQVAEDTLGAVADLLP